MNNGRNYYSILEEFSDDIQSICECVIELRQTVEDKDEEIEDLKNELTK